ncbi:hypothetical protein ACFX11_002996 [Malus domestica]
MELSIASHGKKKLITDLKRDKVFTPKVDNTGKKPTNKAFIVHTTLCARQDLLKKQNEGDEERELKQKTYSFPNSDVAAMLNDLLDKRVIELPECKHPE